MAKTPAIRGKNNSFILPAVLITSLLVSPCINPTSILSKLVIKITNNSCSKFTFPNPVIKINAMDPNMERSIPITDLPSRNVILEVGVKLIALSVLSTFSDRRAHV